MLANGSVALPLIIGFDRALSNNHAKYPTFPSIKVSDARVEAGLRWILDWKILLRG